MTTLSLAEAAERLHCKRRKLFELLKDGRLCRAVRLGKEVRVTAASIDALERELVAPAPKPRPRRRFRPPAASAAAAVLAIPLDS